MLWFCRLKVQASMQVFVTWSFSFWSFFFFVTILLLEPRVRLGLQGAVGTRVLLLLSLLELLTLRIGSALWHKPGWLAGTCLGVWLWLFFKVLFTRKCIKIIYFKKIIFDISITKWFKNIKKILISSKKIKKFKFF